MPLALFDIDGTLARSTHVDDRAFVRAVSEVFGLSGFSTDWMDYRHQTDSGLCAEIVGRGLGRAPTAEETARVAGRCLELLEEAVATDPGAIVPMPGAVPLLERLVAGPSWTVAIATGSWLSTARFKLGRAGIDRDRFPLATAEDALDRAEIVRTAICRAVGQASSLAQESGTRGKRGRLPYDHVVYVGDGIWDYRAAQRLRIGFVGVAAGGSRVLRDAGVVHLLTDFADADHALAALQAALRRDPLGLPLNSS